MPVKKGQLRPRDHLQIQRNFDVLCENLEPDDIIDYLISNLVFNLDDREAIKAEKTRRDRAGKCVELILRAGTKLAFSNCHFSVILIHCWFVVTVLSGVSRYSWRILS